MMPFWWRPPEAEVGSDAWYYWTLRWQDALPRLRALYPDGKIDEPGSCLPPWDLLTLAQKAASAPPGCIVEVGVYKGGSAYQLTRVALAQSRQIYLYDTFAGMPACDPTIDTIAVGELDNTSYEEVRAAVGPYPHIYKCVFPFDVDLPPEGVAFAHIDVDQYQAYLDTCQALAPLMVPGGIMWFDDVTDLEGARKAVRELFPEGAVQTCPDSGRWFVVFN